MLQLRPLKRLYLYRTGMDPYAIDRYKRAAPKVGATILLSNAFEIELLCRMLQLMAIATI